MKVSKLDQMVKGWFIGDFEPSLCRTGTCEAAVKTYRKGDYEEKHSHKIATEYTVIVKGKVKMFDTVFSEGSIVVAEPGDATDFTALEDTVNVVIKLPGAKNDKYPAEGR